jgi:hypothetical protein
MRSSINSVCRSVAPLVGVLALASPAHATYTVVDADLYPTAVLEGRGRPLQPPAPENLKVAFARGSTRLGPIARATVESLLPRLRSAAAIKIIGHVDSATPTESEQQHVLAMTRASALRAYLVKAGVPASIIDIDADGSGNPTAKSGISAADLLVTAKPDPRASVAAQAREQIRVDTDRAIPGVYPHLQQQEPTAASGETAADSRLVEYINRAVQSGQMAPAVAAQILRSLATTRGSTSAPAPAAPVRIERWVLDARFTLRDNLDEWARISGWRPVLWEASNFYRVTRTSTLDGAFPDVLRRIADSTGLNICVHTGEKVVRVTDGNVACTANAQ